MGNGTRAFIGYEGVVQSDWIDVNGHMNVGWYDRVFDMSEVRLLHFLGLNEDYVRRERHGFFRIEKSIRYERELLLGDKIRIEARIAAFSGKAMQQEHRLMDLTHDRVAATARYSALHVDLATRKVAPVVQPQVLAALTEMAGDHGAASTLARS